MMKFQIQKTYLAFALSFCALLLVGCGGTKKTESSVRKSRIPRDFHIDPDTQVGLIYGKIIHNQNFGSKFEIVLSDQKANTKHSIMIESYGSSPEENIFLELEPGEWQLHQVKLPGGAISIPALAKDEHREIIVEKAKISYVGTWRISSDSLSVTDNKIEQDKYMRRNYQYVLTSGALVTLP